MRKGSSSIAILTASTSSSGFDEDGRVTCSSIHRHCFTVCSSASNSSGFAGGSGILCGAQPAFQLMMLEHLQALAQTAATAISNIKFDKIIVWDSGNGANGTGSGGAAGFLQSLARSIPPMMNVVQDLGGVKMPEFLGKFVTDTGDGKPATRPDPAPTAPSTKSDTGASTPKKG